MKPPFEYCALRALMLWDREERELHEGMLNPTPDVVRNALKHFGVARSFPGIASDPKGLQYIADTVRDITNHGNLTASDAQKVVALLAERFKEKFTRSSISAASNRLYEMAGFLSSCLQPPLTLNGLVGEDWFHQRIFDVYVWEAGGEGQSGFDFASADEERGLATGVE